MLRYLSDRMQARIINQEQQQQKLLGEILSKKHEYGELLRILQAYPWDVVRNCHDTMGNTLLQLVLSQNMWQRRKEVEHNDAEKPKMVEVSSKGRWKLFRGENKVQAQQEYDDEKAFLKLLHYLVHVADRETEEHERDKGFQDDQATAGRNPICYNSLIRIKSASGSLPLHTACRCILAANSLQHKQQLDAVEFLVQAYPVAVQCPDTWGNLPLHDLCDVATCVRLEVLILLVQQWPESVRIPNSNGDLPLHLAAGAGTATENMMHAVTSVPKSDRSNESEDIDDYAASIGSPRSVVFECPDQSPQKTIIVEDNNGQKQQQGQQQQHQLEIVQYLVDYWPEAVNKTNNQGQTPLEHAQTASNINHALIEFLQACSPTFQLNSPVSTSKNIITTSNAIENKPLLEDASPLDQSEGNCSVATVINPFDSDQSDNSEYQGDSQNSDSEVEGTMKSSESYYIAKEENGTNTGSPDCLNSNIESKESGLDDVSMDDSSTSSGRTECSTGVELVEDFQVVENDGEPFEHSMRLQEEYAPMTIVNEAERDIDFMNGSLNANSFDQNSMSTIS